MFGLKKKGDGDVPPDVGAEEKYDASKGAEKSGSSNSDSKIGGGGKVPEGVATSSSAKPVAAVGSSMVPAGDFEMEKLNSRIDSVVEWIKQFYDRFSYVSESIGELRGVGMANEKNIAKSIAEAEKAIDVVKEVKPQELRMDYQKIDVKISTLTEKIAANNQFMEEIMKEMNDLRRKSEVFIGTEGLMKLNEDTKKDLVKIQKVNSKVKIQADKAQEIFMELRKGFAESQKVGAIVENLDESYSGLKEEIEKVKLDRSKVIGQKEFLDFRKSYGNKLTTYDNLVADVQSLKDNVGELGGLVETSLSVSRENKEDVSKIALNEGVSDVKGINEYQGQVSDMADIIEKLSVQISDVKEELGVKTDKVPAKKVLEKVVEVAKKPSEDEEVKEAVKAVKIAKVPKLKPEEFSGEKDLLNKRVDDSLEKAKKKSAKKKSAKKKSVEKEDVMGDVGDDVADLEEDAPLFDI